MYMFKNFIESPHYNFIAHAVQNHIVHACGEQQNGTDGSHY